jgi:hypothetical protein
MYRIGGWREVGRILNLGDVTVGGYLLSPSLPPLPPALPPPIVPDHEVSLFLSRGASLTFGALTNNNLPRGATLRAVELHVTPHSGRSGKLDLDVRAELECDDTVVPGPSSFVEWEMQPYDFKFGSDQAPDLSPLLSEQIARRAVDGLENCKVKVHLEPTSGTGTRWVATGRAGFWVGGAIGAGYARAIRYWSSLQWRQSAPRRRGPAYCEGGRVIET